MTKQEDIIISGADSSASETNNKELSWRKTSHRWIALAFACFTMIGSYLSNDFPQNLEDQLEDSNNMDLSIAQVNMLYTVYSFPNIGLPLVGGILIDAVGIRKSTILFLFLLFLGQAVCSIAVMNSIKSYVLLIVGRVIFGLGGENLQVAQNTIMSQWFQGKELSLVFGLALSVSRIGSILSTMILPAVYSASGNLFVPLMIGALSCALSLLSGFCLSYMDRRADKQEGKEQVKLSDDDRIKLSDVKKLGFQYWLIAISCTLTYINIFPFMQVLQKYLILQFGMDSDNATQFLSIPYFISVILTPLTGKFVDVKGKRGLLIMISTIIMILSHITFLLVPQRSASNPDMVSYWFILPLVTIGIFYSMYGAIIWPCVSLVCDPKIVGTGFGIVNCIQNASLAIAPLITALIIDGTSRDNGYFYNQVFFICTSIVCNVLNIYIYFHDLRTTRALDKVYTSEKSEDEQPKIEDEDDDVNEKLVKKKATRQSVSARRSFKS